MADTKTDLLKALVGKRVRLLHEMRTKGGTLFPEGTIMVVSGRWRSGVSMRDAADESRIIAHVAIAFSTARGVLLAPFVVLD